jgi:hypothetical protein
MKIIFSKKIIMNDQKLILGYVSNGPLRVGRFPYGFGNISNRQWGETAALEIGAFLIRFSNSCKDCYALSIRVPYFANATGVAHYLITRNES